MSQNRQLVASLRQALRQNGVEDADVLTSDFAIHRERGSQSQRGVDRPGERFVVRNLLQVTIRDIERAGVLLDRLVEAGANEVRGIRFTLQDDTQMALQGEPWQRRMPVRQPSTWLSCTTPAWARYCASPSPACVAADPRR
jgi:uncharacterized protein YggE